MATPMECRIRKHDSRQFEIKVAYPLERRGGPSRHELEMFLFFPYQIGIDRSTYTREEFYEDLRSYTRYKTPVLSLREVANDDLPASPLTRVRRMLAAGRTGGAWDEARLLYEMKMLGNVIRTQVRDGARYVRRLVRERGSGSWQDVILAAEGLLTDLGDAVRKFRSLRSDILHVTVPEAVRRAYELVDEFVSVQTEDLLLDLLNFLQTVGQCGAEMAGVCARLRQFAETECGHRASCGYPALVSGDSRRNEYFLYRESSLKKFCANVLFLSLERREGDRRARQLLNGLAAGLAMAFAVAVAWAVGKRFPQDTLPFAVAVIVAYIFKDRIKELTREYGARLIPHWARDRAGKLVDPQHGDQIGSTSETMRWREVAELPREVIEARKYTESLERDISTPTEQVIHYLKEITIDNEAIYRSHERSAAIDEILRVQVNEWLERMDNPRKPLWKADKDAGGISRILAPRVYHVNVVVRLTSHPAQGAALRKVRVVLDKNGIKRIENHRFDVGT